MENEQNMTQKTRAKRVENPQNPLRAWFRLTGIKQGDFAKMAEMNPVPLWRALQENPDLIRNLPIQTVWKVEKVSRVNLYDWYRATRASEETK